MLPRKPPEKEAEYHRVYAQLRFKTHSERLNLAREADGDTLCAMCLDPNPQIIIATINNSSFGPVQARLVARYHRSLIGLDYLVKNPSYARDAGVRQALFRNPISSRSVLNKCFANMNLFTLMRLAMGHEASQHTVKQSRLRLRQGFSQATPEECAHFILQTEGRCLRFLYGLTFKDPTKDILAKQTYTSFILARNLLNFPAVPPDIVRALAKSPIIWRHPEFRRRILGHRNCPADIKINR
jgi:hypothetical protein